MICYPFFVDGLMTRVQESGEGNDYLLLIHGLGARADRWRLNIDELAAHGYHVLTVDLPGHGFAAKGGGFDYSVSGYTRFVEAFVRTYGIKSPTLVGTSLGGHIAGYYAVRNPTNTKALVLVGSLGLVPLGRDKRSAIGKRIAAVSHREIRDKLERIVVNHRLITSDWVEEEFRINSSFGAREAFESLGDYISSHVDEDVILEELVALTSQVPIVLIWGSDDQVVPLSTARRVQQELGPAELEVVERAGHLPYYERPAEFNRALLVSLARLP